MQSEILALPYVAFIIIKERIRCLGCSTPWREFGFRLAKIKTKNSDYQCVTLHERIQDFSQQKEEEIHLLAHLTLKLELVTTFINHIFSYTCRPEQTVGVRTR